MALTRFVGGNVSGFPARLRRRPAARRWMARGPVALLLLLALALALGVLPAQAETVALVSNLGQPHGNDTPGIVGTVQLGDQTTEHRRIAQRFTTGGNPHGYTLSDVQAYISGWGSGDAVSVSIHSADSSGKPGSSLYELENQDLHRQQQPQHLHCGRRGDPGEGDRLLRRVRGAHRQTTSVEVILDNDEDAGRAEGWSIRDGRHRKIDDNSWSAIGQSVRIEINGTINDVKLVGNLEQQDTYEQLNLARRDPIWAVDVCRRRKGSPPAATGPGMR